MQRHHHAITLFLLSIFSLTACDARKSTTPATSSTETEVISTDGVRLLHIETEFFGGSATQREIMVKSDGTASYSTCRGNGGSGVDPCNVGSFAPLTPAQMKRINELVAKAKKEPWQVPPSDATQDCDNTHTSRPAANGILIRRQILADDGNFSLLMVESMCGTVKVRVGEASEELRRIVTEMACNRPNVTCVAPN